MIWHIVIFAVILVLTNLFWLLAYLRQGTNALETHKLIASKTVSEYSWLKKAESQVQEAPKKPSGYQTVWEDEDEQG